MAMTYGIHLPQYGRVASGDAVSRAARHAEDLGFSDVWVSDHIVHPAEQTYPSPFLLDPFATLSWAAAVTTRVRLGTSVLVVPQHNPVWLANHLASVDAMSGGRLIVGAGVGWSKREYDALGQSFETGARRMDEIIDLLRAAWSDDPVTFDGAGHHLDAIRFLPKPAGEIPIWIGGGVEASFRRARRQGRRLPRRRPEAAGAGPDRGAPPARPAGAVVHHLGPHRLGPAGDGSGSHPRGERGVRGRGRPAHGGGAVAEGPRRLAPLHGPPGRHRPPGLMSGVRV